jgi:uncharacterized repeat protein (TIGR03806 family)
VLRFLLVATLFSAALIAAACDGDTTDTEPQPVVVTPAACDAPYEKLSEWNLFADGVAMTPAQGVTKYQVIAPLFSDYTTKSRFIYLPPGEKIAYDGSEVWQFPLGTILVKAFGHAPKVSEPNVDVTLRETRLLCLGEDGWVPHTYIWDDAQQDAVREVAGKFIEVAFEGPDGEPIETNYRVPNTNECKTCHATDEVVAPLGTRTRQLDFDVDGVNQLEAFANAGMFDVGPPPYPEREHLVDPQDTSQDLFLRVRSYWDSNCASCHRDGNEAQQSGLYLAFDKTDPETLTDQSTIGLCKTPTSAGGATCGNSIDVVPGDPDASIMICRMSVEEPKWRMPPLGSLVVHQEGLALLREWVASLDPTLCEPAPE